MALLTGKEYLESLKEFSPEIYIRGERVQEVWSHPLLRQTVNHIAAGYDFALDPRYQSVSAVRSPLVGEEVPRLQLHIQESLDDDEIFYLYSLICIYYWICTSNPAKFFARRTPSAGSWSYPIPALFLISSISSALIHWMRLSHIP
jgi:hypothetical protein